MDKAAIYTRFSSNNQTEMSTKAQLDACTEYAKSQNMDIYNVYSDEAKTGTNTNRPEFLKMIDAASNGMFKYVLIHKTDRFSRSIKDTFVYKSMLEECGVKVISITEPFDGSPIGNLTEHMSTCIAQFYVENLSQEVHKGQRQAAKEGLFLGGTPPLGYNIINQKYHIDEHNSKAVQVIFDMYDNGYSYNNIAQRLNELGYKTQAGKDFGKNSIRSILLNEKYTGVYVYNLRKSKGRYRGKRNNNASKPTEEIIKIENIIPQIISKEKFDRVQTMIQSHSHLKGGKKHRYILSGKVKCGCGGCMHGNTRKAGRNKKQTSYYRCNKYNNEIQVIYVDAYVIRCATKALFYQFNKTYKDITDSFNEYVKNNTSSLNAEINTLKLKIDGNNKKIKNLINKLSDIEENSRTTKTITDKINELENLNISFNNSLDNLNNEINRLYQEAQVKEAFNGIGDYIKTHDTLAVRQFIEYYIDEVEINKAEDSVTSYVK